MRGALPATLAAAGVDRRLVLPADNGGEAALAGDDAARTATHLADVAATLAGGELHWSTPVAEPRDAEQAGVPDLAEVRGQPQAKRALEIAAAGGHSLLMIGPPGAGKTMLASRLVGLLPPLEREQALEVAAIASISGGGFDPSLWGRRPFRAPHHTASGVALVGGGSTPRPGEITLAHRGVLFLDELPEFDRRVLEVLREPLESGHIVISRAARQSEFPAAFQLVAAMNPCPCGYQGDASGRCHCTPDRIERYRARISGPLLDRIDMHLNVAPITKKVLMAEEPEAERSIVVQGRVRGARSRADARSGCSQCGATPGAGRCALRAERRGSPVDRAGHRPTWAFGARLSSNPARGAHDRRSGRPRADPGARYRRSDRLSPARSTLKPQGLVGLISAIIVAARMKRFATHVSC